MLRFVAFMWNPNRRTGAVIARRLAKRLVAESSHWSCVLEQPGVCVYCSVRSPLELTRIADDGVILGHIFPRLENPIDGSKSHVVVDAAAARRVIETDCRALMQLCWGNYVAIAHDACRGSTSVFRGPCSSIPCLHFSHHEVQVVCSSLDDSASIVDCRLEVDWQAVAFSLVSPYLGRRTALKGVIELQPGECLTFAADEHSTSPYWDAYAAASSARIECEEEAAEELHRTVRRTVHAWASRFPRIMTTVSGGLDSSIVLACLKAAPSQPDIIGFTEYSPGPDSDERVFARAIANHDLPCRLIEHRRQSNARLDRLADCSRLPAPQLFVRRAELLDAEAEYLRACAADVVFSGSGGDSVFYQHPVAARAIDFVQSRRIRPALARIAYETAKAELLSVWKVLGDSIYYGLRPERYNFEGELLKGRRLVSDAVLRAYGDSHQGDRGRACRLPPGKAYHAKSLSIPDGYYDPLAKDGGVDRVAPLLSEPVVNTALRIPTYVLTRGGWDRGLARRAFSSELPSQIAYRREKGGIEEHMNQLLHANIEFVREMLVDGHLVRKGFLDRTAVRQAVGEQHARGNVAATAEIFTVLCTEIWIRSWRPVALLG